GDCVTNSAGQLPVPLCHTATMQFTTLDSYVPGTLGFPPSLVSGQYADDAGGNFTQFTSSLEFFELPAMDGTQEASLRAIPSFFATHADGTWRFEAEEAAPNCGPDNGFLDNFCGYFSSGINGTWTRAAVPVPEPSTLALVAIGFVGLVGLCR